MTLLNSIEYILELLNISFDLFEYVFEFSELNVRSISIELFKDHSICKQFEVHSINSVSTKLKVLFIE